MSNRCALRRFDGHGSSSYKPTNPEVSKEFSSNLAALMAERERQDSGIFRSVSNIDTPQPITISKSENKISIPVQTQPINNAIQYYSLSDSTINNK
jgi:hypothetical protein